MLMFLSELWKDMKATADPRSNSAATKLMGMVVSVNGFDDYEDDGPYRF